MLFPASGILGRVGTSYGCSDFAATKACIHSPYSFRKGELVLCGWLVTWYITAMQELLWDKTNKGNRQFNGHELFACLVLAHFSHPSMAVVYHVTDHVANKTILRLPSHGKGGIFDRLERFPNFL